jgi:signal transduction histidine kinase
MNLISNAIKNTEIGEININIYFDHDKGQLVFLAADNGKGIKQEDQDTIFKLFS